MKEGTTQKKNIELRKIRQPTEADNDDRSADKRDAFLFEFGGNKHKRGKYERKSGHHETTLR